MQSHEIAAAQVSALVHSGSLERKTSSLGHQHASERVHDDVMMMMMIMMTMMFRTVSLSSVQSPITTTAFPARGGMQALHSEEGYNICSWTNFRPCLQGALHERYLAHGNTSSRYLSICAGILAASSATAYLCIGRDRVKKPAIREKENRENLAFSGRFVASTEGLHSNPDHLVVLVNGIAGRYERIRTICTWT